MNLTTHTEDNRSTRQRTFARKVQDLFRPRARRHDRLLVLSLALFNSGESWAQVFSPLKVREKVG